MSQNLRSIPLRGRCLPAMDELPAGLPEGTLIRLLFDQNTPLALLDRRIEQAACHGLRIQLAPVETPGYHPQSAQEPNFVTTPALLEDFCAFWSKMAARYAGTSAAFVLLHCPYGYWNTLPDLGPAEYAVLVRKAEKAIHGVEANRSIVVDGMDGGRYIPTDLFDLATRKVSLCAAWKAADIQRASQSFAGMLKLWTAYRQATGQDIICLLRQSPQPSDFEACLSLLEHHQIQVIQW